MKLKELLNRCSCDFDPNEIFDINVEGLSYDSRKIKENYLFFAIKGYKEDGNKYIDSAIKNGASVIITESDVNSLKKRYKDFKLNFLRVNDIRKCMANVSSEFYSRPSENLKLIGITGTNGKTTIAFLIKAILEEAGGKCGLIGTIDYMIGDEKIVSSLTTPESVEINKMLSDMISSGLEFCVMEVSSIALTLERVHGLSFDAGIFTNLSSEHLDLHETMENYFQAKKQLFDMLNDNGIAISNIDDIYGEKILGDTFAMKVFYSISTESQYRAMNETFSIEGLEFEISLGEQNYKIHSKLSGRFNIYNVLAAIAITKELNIDMEIIQKVISKFEPVNGRFNKINLPNGAYAVIDYSHTSDSLKNAIESAIEIRDNQMTKGRVITVFGCGGNKDKTKRSVMGEYATSLSDHTIITSDNPRYEKPMDIINEILNGIDKNKSFEVEEKRQEAIKKGIMLSSEGDIILICGKGHETYQEVEGVRTHFDDKEVVEKYLHLAS
jgi:UDP-N-acetylmuramoyl-L-alanyl-D-glutamate--2,6-diaminopimelate ligase